MILTLLFKGDSRLHQAARKGQDNVVKYLVNIGADVSAVNNEVSNFFNILIWNSNLLHLSDSTF